MADAARSLWPVGRCDSCHAPVIWAVTAWDKTLPVDPDPAMPKDGQPAVLLTSRGPTTPPLAEVTRSAAKWAGKRTPRRRHQDTCPFRAHHQQQAITKHTRRTP